MKWDQREGLGILELSGGTSVDLCVLLYSDITKRRDKL